MTLEIIALSPEVFQKYFSKLRVSKAEKYWTEVKVDYITEKHIGFSVSKYSVIYFSEKKFPYNWSCSCKRHTLKGDFCSHILAIFLRLSRDKTFLGNLKKTFLKGYPKQHESKSQLQSK